MPCMFVDSKCRVDRFVKLVCCCRGVTIVLVYTS